MPPDGPDKIEKAEQQLIAAGEKLLAKEGGRLICDAWRMTARYDHFAAIDRFAAIDNCACILGALLDGQPLGFDLNKETTVTFFNTKLDDAAASLLGITRTEAQAIRAGFDLCDNVGAAVDGHDNHPWYKLGVKLHDRFVPEKW
jgi:hypothetical protein